MPLVINVVIDGEEIDRLVVVSTSYVKKGLHLYRVREPEKYNHLEIFHDRKEPWTVLLEKVLHAINEHGA